MVYSSGRMQISEGQSYEARGPFFSKIFYHVNNTSKGCMNSSRLRLAYIQNMTFKSIKRNVAIYIIRKTVCGKKGIKILHTDVQKTSNVENERGNKDF